MPVVSFVNMKGGVAKTTLAVNVADALVRREDCSVLVVDLDPQFNATQCLISGENYVARRTKGEKTILNIFDDGPPISSLVGGSKSRPQHKLEDVHPWKVSDGLYLVAGDLELYRLDVAAGQGREHRLKRYLEAIKAKEKYDYIIIDTPPTPSAWMMSGLLASDFYLVPLKPEPLSTTGIDLLRGVIQRCSENYAHPLECVGVVLTIAEENTVVYRDAVSFLDNNDVWKGKRFQHPLPKRTQIARVQAEQKLILDTDDSAAKAALVSITGELVERVTNG